MRSLRPDAPPVPLCGCAPDAVTLEAVTAAGARPAERWHRTVGNAAGRILEVAAPPGDGWPDANAAPLVTALVEGEADALARLRLPGVLVRAAGGTAGVRRGAALVADLHDAGRTCYAAVLLGGDLDAVLRGAIDVDLAAQHAERAATARSLARLLEQLPCALDDGAALALAWRCLG